MRQPQAAEENYASPYKKIGIQKLDTFLQGFQWQSTLTEWGAPPGKLARLVPALLSSSISQQCLWLYDQTELQIYPSAWNDLGFDLSRLHFMAFERPFKNFKTIFNENPFDLLVLDTSEPLQTSDFSYLASLSRKTRKNIFVLRHFFLSNNNGNPFCRYRFNSSFQFYRSYLSVSSIKGIKSNLYMPMSEVFHG